MKAYRVRVDDLCACDRLHVFRHVGDGGGHVRHTLDGEGDIVRGERRAVGEGDTGAQLEFPGGVVDQAPCDREAGGQAVPRIHRGERLEQIGYQALVAAEVVVVRVYGVRLDREAETKLPGDRGRCQAEHRRQEECKAPTHHALHTELNKQRVPVRRSRQIGGTSNCHLPPDRRSLEPARSVETRRPEDDLWRI